RERSEQTQTQQTNDGFHRFFSSHITLSLKKGKPYIIPGIFWIWIFIDPSTSLIQTWVEITVTTRYERARCHSRSYSASPNWARRLRRGMAGPKCHGHLPRREGDLARPVRK